MYFLKQRILRNNLLFPFNIWSNITHNTVYLIFRFIYSVIDSTVCESVCKLYCKAIDTINFVRAYLWGSIRSGNIKYSERFYFTNVWWLAQRCNANKNGWCHCCFCLWIAWKLSEKKEIKRKFPYIYNLHIHQHPSLASANIAAAALQLLLSKI